MKTEKTKKIINDSLGRWIDYAIKTGGLDELGRLHMQLLFITDSLVEEYIDKMNVCIDLFKYRVKIGNKASCRENITICKRRRDKIERYLNYLDKINNKMRECDE